MRKLDRIDQQILDILQRMDELRLVNWPLASTSHTTPCSERVKRLEADGIIMGYYATQSTTGRSKLIGVFRIKLSPNLAMCLIKWHVTWSKF